MSLKQQGINAAKWSFLGTIISPLKNFIVSLFLARLLSPDDFGVIGMSMAFVGIIDGLVDFGMGSALMQKQNTTEEQKNTVFYVNMLMGLILSICMFCSAGIISNYFEMPIVKPVTQVLSLIFILKGFNCVQNAQMKKELNFKTPFVAGLTGGIISGIAGIVLAFLGCGVWSLVTSQLLGNIITTIFIWGHSKWRPQIIFNLGSIKELWQFGYKLSLTQLIEVGVNRLDTFMIGRAFSAATLGYYYRAGSLNQLVIQYSYSSFGSVLFPMFSKIQHDYALVKDSLEKLLHLISFSLFGLSGFMYLFASDIISVVFSDKWLPAVPFFKIMAIFSFTIPFDRLYYSILQGLGKSSEILKIRIIAKSIYIIALFLGLQMGVYGVVFGVYFSHFVQYMMMAFQIQKTIDYPLLRQLRLLIIYAFIPVILILGFNLCPFSFSPIMNIIIKGGIFSLLYFLANKLLNNMGLDLITGVIKEQLRKIFPNQNLFFHKN